MQAEEHRRRNFRVEEIGHAGRGGIDGAETQQRNRRHAGHQGDGEEVHHHEADQKQEGIDVRCQGQGGGNLLSPGQAGGAGH